jgi:spore coat protein U-like protein
MKLLTKLSYLLLVSLFLSTIVSAQNTASESVPVTVQLERGLSITSADDIDFGPIVLDGTAQSPSEPPNTGALFTVLGHPTKSVVVTFSNETLTNNNWVTTYGGTNDNLTFTPNVEYTTAPAYAGQLPVTSGTGYALTNTGGIGYLYLWAGGSLAIDAAQEPGDYVGTFTITVAY